MAQHPPQFSPVMPPATTTSPESSPESWVGERYEIQSELGSPASSPEPSTASCPVQTFLAWDHQTSRSVVLKALAFEQLHSWKQLEHFEQEARALAQLSHSAIPQYLDYLEHRSPGATASTFYLVQAWVPGCSLGERVRRGDRFTETEVMAIARQSLGILSYLHGLHPPVVHRDIKPDNLICSDTRHSVTRDDNTDDSPPDHSPSSTPASSSATITTTITSPKIYLVDFGAAQTISSSSTVIGTYGYMAPEQFRGQASPASDLYSLGATLLNLLTHQDPVALPTHRLRIAFRSVVNLSDDFAQWLDGLIAPVAADRFSTADQALAALDNPALNPLSLQSPNEDPLTCHQAPTAPNSPHLVRHCFSQPDDSAIRLTRHSGSYPLGQPGLILDIPPMGLKRELLALGGFALLWNGGLLYWLIMAWTMDAPWFYPLASAPLWGMGLWLTGWLGRSFFGQVRLLVQGNEYCLEQRLGPVCQTQRGPLADWQTVGLRKQYSQGSEAVNAIALVLDMKTIELGVMLSPAEQAWLVEELRDFLAESR